jgi:hypothetical protein
MIPLPRHSTWIDDTEKGTNVFVPGIMGVGVLLSLGILISDGIARVRGTKGKRRERDLIAGYIADDVLSSIHVTHTTDPARGLRKRTTYLAAGAVFTGVGIYGLFGSFWNYINPVDDGWVEDVAWAWAVSMVAVVGLVSIGLLLIYFGMRHPDLPPWARRFLSRTPIGIAPDEG